MADSYFFLFNKILEIDNQKYETFANYYVGKKCEENIYDFFLFFQTRNQCAHKTFVFKEIIRKFAAPCTKLKIN
jgi:hypothetical protein